MFIFKRFICILLFISSSAYSAQMIDKISASVNNDLITYKELEKKINNVYSGISDSERASYSKNAIRDQVLDKLITDKVLLQLADSYGIDVDTFMINNTISNIANQYNLTVDEYYKKQFENGFSRDEVRNNISNDLKISFLQQREVVQDVSVSKSDVDGFMNSPVGQEAAGVSYKLLHIKLDNPNKPTPELINKVEKQAKTIVAKIKNRDDFERMARLHSKSSTSLEGGNMGWREISSLPTLFMGYVPQMKIGEISEPIRTSSGFHIIMLDDKKYKNIEDEYHVSHIVINSDSLKSEKDIEVLLTDVKNSIGNDLDAFKDQARKISTELQTAQRGGDMGWVGENSLLPDFYNAVSLAELNKVYGPIRTSQGYHLIFVHDKRSSTHNSTYAREQAREILRSQKIQDQTNIWIKKVLKDSQVEIF